MGSTVGGGHAPGVAQVAEATSRVGEWNSCSRQLAERQEMSSKGGHRPLKYLPEAASAGSRAGEEWARVRGPSSLNVKGTAKER